MAGFFSRRGGREGKAGKEQTKGDGGDKRRGKEELHSVRRILRKKEGREEIEIRRERKVVGKRRT